MTQCQDCTHDEHGARQCSRDVFDDQGQPLGVCLCRGRATCPVCGDLVQSRALINGGRGRFVLHGEPEPCSGSNKVLKHER